MEKSTTFFTLLIVLGLLFCEAESQLINNALENFQTQPKIVNGKPVKLAEIPYQVALYDINGFQCGGSFVVINSKHFVITAAHCVEDDPYPENYLIIAGEVGTYNVESPAQVRNVTKIIVHEEYVHTPSLIVNDIAILAIGSPFEINKYVSPIRLPRNNERVGSIGVVSGWGRLTDSGPYSSTLQKANILLVPNKLCKIMYRDAFHPETMICAGFLKGACSGDSGGPLKDSRKGFLAGIVSFGKGGCTKPKASGVYTRVSAFVKWIEMQAQRFNDKSIHI